MEFVRPNGSTELPPNLLRVCLECGTLACTFDDGTVAKMRPSKVEVLDRAS